MSPIRIARVRAEGKPLTVRVDANLERRVQDAAAREGVSVSDFVRGAITERLDRGPTDSSLWDRVAPSVLRRQAARGGGSSPGERVGALTWQTELPPIVAGHRRSKRDQDTHREFAAGLEAEAAEKWHRLDD